MGRFPTSDRGAEVALVTCGLGLAVVLVRSAWVADDAFITLRTVDNFVRGYGLTWNPSERVQAYTHPLWMFVLSAGYAFTREPFYTTVALSFALNTLAVLLFICRLARTTRGAILGIVVLLVSKAFVDYSVSGMENPLSHLLIALFLWAYFERDESQRTTLLLFGIASLALVNRLDAAVFYFPPLACRLWRFGSRKSLSVVAAGFAPLILWECFSLLYYGFPIPNTAFAKLTTGIPTSAMIHQGLRYLADSLQTDPVTLPAIVTGVALPFLLRDRDAIPVGIGVLFHLLYVVWIGGDFMSGRLLSLPLFCTVILIARCEWGRLRSWAVALALALVLGMRAPFPTILCGSDFGSYGDDPIGAHGIADERRFYFQYAGLLNMGKRLEEHPWASRGIWAREENVQVMVYYTVGYFGFFAGQGVHIVDPFGVADPLLSKIPVDDPNWRIGHFRREVPSGYVESLASDRNLIEDPRLAEYYDRLRSVTRGRLLDPDRLSAIWHVNVRERYPLLPEK